MLFYFYFLCFSQVRSQTIVSPAFVMQSMRFTTDKEKIEGKENKQIKPILHEQVFLDKENTSPMFPCQVKLARVDDKKVSIFPCQGKLVKENLFV